MSALVVLQPEDCLEWGHNPLGDPCEGAVEYRMSLSPSGRSFPRCERHWLKRLDEQERINERYPDSPCPPSWFDPLAAGESWDED